VQPYDWAGLLTRRLTETGAPAPLAGFVANGYRLVYTDTPTAAFKNAETNAKRVDLTYSLGITLDKDGEVTGVGWNSPAYTSSIDIGTKIVGVNGTAYSDTAIRAAVVTAKTSKDPIQLLVKNGEKISAVAIDYHGGARYPRLEKIAPGEAGLDRLLAAK
jgi:predicted metalloprotease with PDZ domain